MTSCFYTKGSYGLSWNRHPFRQPYEAEYVEQYYRYTEPERDDDHVSDLSANRNRPRVVGTSTNGTGVRESGVVPKGDDAGTI